MITLFSKKDFGLFNEYFLKWVQKSSFLTSITYSLTPRTSNLVIVGAKCFIKRFTWRLNEIGGCRGCASSFRSQFVSKSLIGREIGEQPIRSSVSYSSQSTPAERVSHHQSFQREPAGNVTALLYMTKLAN